MGAFPGSALICGVREAAFECLSGIGIEMWCSFCRVAFGFLQNAWYTSYDLQVALVIGLLDTTN